MKLAGPRRGRNFRAPMIDRGPGSAIACGSVLMLRLQVRSVEAALAKCAFLFRTGMHIDSACATVVTDPVHGDVIYNRLVIDVNISDGHIGHPAVIEKGAAPPISASVAGTEISEAVVHATIEADVRSPISGMPDVVPG